MKLFFVNFFSPKVRRATKKVVVFGDCPHVAWFFFGIKKEQEFLHSFTKKRINNFHTVRLWQEFLLNPKLQLITNNKLRLIYQSNRKADKSTI